MLTGFLHLHNFMRWIALIAILVAIVKSFNGMKKNSAFTKSDNLWSLLTLIAFHIQLLLGFVLFFAKGWAGMFGEMSDRLIRFFTVEHTLGMVIAITLVTIGRISSKKMSTDKAKHKRIFRFFLIALIITLISIPWPFRELIGRGWFPGMPVH